MGDDGDSAFRRRACKSCSQCTKRKVRCIVGPGDSSKCVHCVRRGEACEFREVRRKLRTPKRDEESSSPQPTRPLPASMHDGFAPLQTEATELFVDQMLDKHPVSGLLQDDVFVFKTSGQRVSISNLAYFSENRIASLSQRLGNNRLRELLESIEDVIEARLPTRCVPSVSPRVATNQQDVPPDVAKSYIDAYFVQLHAIYPFLDRAEFEKTAFGPNLPRTLATNPAFSALYHAVLALGSQYYDGAAFDPGKGRAWRLFQVSLALVPDIVVLKEGLLNLQALVAMSVFALNMSCLHLDEILMKEAARMAISLGYNKAINRGDRVETAGHKAFWVIYAIEKHSVFNGAYLSPIINDYDIGCPIPETPEAMFGSYNWLLSCVRLSRISSQTYMTLFSASATLNSREANLAAIDATHERLEKWRMTVPDEFRPGSTRQASTFSTPCAKIAALQTQYRYYSIVIVLARLSLHLDPSGQGRRSEESKRALMNSARCVLELTRHMDVDAYTPIFVLGIMPLVALFILFDFVVHNPSHPETRNNLSFLDVAAGHFSLLEFRSGGSLPGSRLSELATIARQYIRENRESEASTPQTQFQRNMAGAGEQPPNSAVSAARPLTPDPSPGTNAMLQVQPSNLPMGPSGYAPYSATWPSTSWDATAAASSDGDLNFPPLEIVPELTDDTLLSGIDMRSLFGPVFSDYGLGPINGVPE